MINMGVRATSMDVFEEFESNVRLYSRSFPAVFSRARGAELVDESGSGFIDFFSGAGSLNYGHAHPVLKERLIEYLASDGIVLALDMSTQAKRHFLRTLQDKILAPRGLKYKSQFCGPTGTNAVEAALKLARLVTKRVGVIAFSGSFHGMSLGSSAVTGNLNTRAAAGMPLSHTTFVPYADSPDGPFDSLGFIRRLLTDQASGVELPAAIIVEPVQMDGGIYAAPPEWLRGLRALCDEFGIILICDEIQCGCGRTGSFFAFERAGIQPDIVTLAKSISGFGIPLAMLLVRPELDRWKAGAHTGTFRANQLALVTGAAALEFWGQKEFVTAVDDRARTLGALAREVASTIGGVAVRSYGMVAGLDFSGLGKAFVHAVQRSAFERGLIIELCGRDDTVLKVMPPLTIAHDQLERGMAIVRDAVAEARQTS
jgi:diaminobutyrate-2-oxoglutarate transaminase